ncbi:MAG: GNAT family N-acetyltransferase [Candidatus Zixiibacteriota bacterium]|nr:MAG: GNAT family N-acetyltransferase [candidate division Zixibacteria bacterium]
MNIRPAQESDRATLTALHIADDIEKYKDAPQVMPALRLSELSSQGRDVILVAEEEGEVVGYFWAVALRVFDYRLGLLFYLYVERSHRRRGIGRKLLQQGIQELHALGVRRFWATPEARNSITRSLLEAVGFEPGPERVFYVKVEPGAQHEWDRG